MVPRRIPTRERGRESSRLRLVNNSVCIKVVARAILRRQRTTTLREGGMLCESWTRLARLNFPDKVSGNVGSGLVARKKKKRETRQRGRDERNAHVQTFPLVERDFLIRILEYGASLCFWKGVRRLSPYLLCHPPPPLFFPSSSFLFNFFPPDAKGASGFPTTMLLSRGARVIVPVLWAEK